jgi:hypothetical protein
MSAHPDTRAYVQRRTKEGLSKKEIIRCLKRYVAREVYPYLRPGADPQAPGAAWPANRLPQTCWPSNDPPAAPGLSRKLLNFVT